MRSCPNLLASGKLHRSRILPYLLQSRNQGGSRGKIKNAFHSVRVKIGERRGVVRSWAASGSLKRSLCRTASFSCFAEEGQGSAAEPLGIDSNRDAGFKPLFTQAESDLQTGLRQTRRFEKDARIAPGDFFILGGQLVYVAGIGETIKTPDGSRSDARLRVIYSNGTESNLLLRSLQRALYKDDAGRRLTDSNPGPLFAGNWEADDIASGTIYVLRSLSNHPFVREHRDLIHKIGVTGGDVEARIANAAHDATYLLAEVEVVATYKLARIDRTKLEAVFHRIFLPAQLDLTIPDRFGQSVRPREWFLVPLHVIDEAVGRIRDGSITNFVYDPQSARLVEN